MSLSGDIYNIDQSLSANGVDNLQLNSLTSSTINNITSQTISYIDGSTSNIQTQLNDLGLRIGLGGSSSWLWLGTFSYGTNNVVGNVVRYLNSTYVALQSSDNKYPTDLSYFALISIDRTGEQGIQGQIGIQGIKGD